jgi:hypothetical protein
MQAQSGTLSHGVQKALGEQLRAAYRDTTEERIPSHHLALLQQIEGYDRDPPGAETGKIVQYKRPKTA